MEFNLNNNFIPYFYTVQTNLCQTLTYGEGFVNVVTSHKN